MYLRFSSNSEAVALELLENVKKYEQHYEPMHTKHRKRREKLLLVEVLFEKKSILEGRDRLHIFFRSVMF